MKKPREYKQGVCWACSKETELERKDSTYEWTCLPCQTRMREKAAARGRADNLFGNIFKEETK